MFPVVMASADVTRAFIPLVASVMAFDLLKAKADLDDHDEVVFTLMRFGHSARAVAQCFIPAIHKAKEATSCAAPLAAHILTALSSGNKSP